MAQDWRLNGYFDPNKMKDLYETISERESCRSFASAPSSEQWSGLLASADAFALPGARIALGMCNNALFQPFFGLLMKFDNVQRFAAVFATEGNAESVINAGISGEMLMLDAVKRGLGGVWVAGTYKHKDVGIKLREGEKLCALIALGVPKQRPSLPLKRKRKQISDICSTNFTDAPSAFREVARAVQAAPSAMNLQPWQLTYEPEGKLTISIKRASQRLDFGIALCHAVLAMGNTSARYTLSEDGLSASLQL